MGLIFSDSVAWARVAFFRFWFEIFMFSEKGVHGHHISSVCLYILNASTKDWMELWKFIWMRSVEGGSLDHIN